MLKSGNLTLNLYCYLINLQSPSIFVSWPNNIGHPLEGNLIQTSLEPLSYFSSPEWVLSYFGDRTRKSAQDLGEALQSPQPELSEEWGDRKTSLNLQMPICYDQFWGISRRHSKKAVGLESRR